MKPVLFAAVCLAVLTASAAEPARVTLEKQGPLSIGLAGYGGAEAARQDAAALQKLLTSRLGREVVSRVFRDYESLGAALAAGQVDLAWMQPSAFVSARRKGAITPVLKAVRQGLPFYRGVIFTKASRNVEGLASLKGGSVAWVSPESSSGYLFPRALLVQSKLDPKALFKAEAFAGDHGEVCRQVVEGRADFGATFADDRPEGSMQVDGCLQSLGAAAAKQLKVVASSAPIPNDAIVVRPAFDAAELAKLSKVMTALSGDPEGQAILKVVFKAEGFVEAAADDFEPVGFAIEAAGR